MTDFIALTPKKRLHTGRSVWSDTRHPPLAVHALKQSMRCDVAIVGAGISGSFMAHALSRNHDVVVLDRREPAMGSTHASTAMLQYEIDTPLTRLADQIGHAKAARAWQRSYRSTQDLIRMVRAEKIACGLSERSALYLAGNEMGARGLEKEARARNRAGLACEFLSARELRARYGIDRTGAIFSDGAAVADPVALARGLLRKARGRGARIFAPCDVKDVMATHHGVMLDTGTHFVEAKHVVFCTGYEAVKGLPTRGTKITSSWAASTAPHTDYPAWLDRTLVWEASAPYLYMRTDGNRRLIVGGEDAELDSPSYRAEILARKAKRLADKTHRLIQVWSPNGPMSGQEPSAKAPMACPSSMPRRGCLVASW
jgi:glycine/D-amino acid oxidase-like deaminating enzyme